ncbi:MAG: cupredoxin domain-containing protein [Dehalococcoidia bacterium]
MAMGASAQAAEGLPVYKQGALLGLTLLALSVVLEAVGFGISGDWGGALVFGGAALVVTFLLAGLVLRFGARAMIPVVILALVVWFFIQGYNFYYELLHPESFFDFIPSMIGLAGSVIVVTSGIVALRETRAHAVRFSPSAVERAVAGTIVVVLGVLFVVSGVLTVSGRSTVSAQDKVGALSVRMHKTEFSPEQIEVAGGEAPRVVVENDDAFLHTFTMDDFAIDVTVRPGSEELIELPALAPGSYTYHCAVDGHESMKGTLEVQ